MSVECHKGFDYRNPYDANLGSPYKQMEVLKINKLC